MRGLGAVLLAWATIGAVVVGVVAMVMLLGLDLERRGCMWAALGLGMVVALAIVAAVLIG